MRGIYLLHFSEPYAHAQHYLGYSDDIKRRIERHRAGKSQQALIIAAIRAGIDLSLVRVWPGAERGDERRLKIRSSGRLCPLCFEEKGEPYLCGTKLPSLYGDALTASFDATWCGPAVRSCAQ